MRIFLALTFILSIHLTSCENPRSEVPQNSVTVTDKTGNPLENAEVYLSYSSVAKPPMYTTDEKGFAIIPNGRASKGGWVSIIAVYYDESGTKHMGSVQESHPSFPLTIKVTPR